MRVGKETTATRACSSEAQEIVSSDIVCFPKQLTSSIAKQPKAKQPKQYLVCYLPGLGSIYSVSTRSFWAYLLTLLKTLLEVCQLCSQKQSKVDSAKLCARRTDGS